MGLIFGSFTNALVWRVKQQEVEQKKKKSDPKHLAELSIIKGRSMCPKCKHELATKDLLPILSWVSLGGKCRYCKKRISVQYPVVEALMGLAFVTSYIWWPESLDALHAVVFGLWLLLLTGLAALLVYDLKWYILPNRIIYPLAFIAGLIAILKIVNSGEMLLAIVNNVLAVAVGGGLFYVIFQLSEGKWIGGGDVKLGWLLGLVLATPARSFLMIFLASLLGCFASLPLLALNRLKRTSLIPFGPFLILAAFIVVLFGGQILDYYTSNILNL